MTGLSIKLYPIQKREHRSSLSSSLHFSSIPHPTLQREKSVVVFLFGVPAIAKLDKILKYQLFPIESETYTFILLSSLQTCISEYRVLTFRTCSVHNHRYLIQFIYRRQDYHNIDFITMEECHPKCRDNRLRNDSNFSTQ